MQIRDFERYISLIVLRLSQFLSSPCGAVVLSAIYDSDISGSYSLAFYLEVTD